MQTFAKHKQPSWTHWVILLHRWLFQKWHQMQNQSYEEHSHVHNNVNTIAQTTVLSVTFNAKNIYLPFTKLLPRKGKSERTFTVKKCHDIARWIIQISYIIQYSLNQPKGLAIKTGQKHTRNIIVYIFYNANFAIVTFNYNPTITHVQREALNMFIVLS